VRTSARAHSRAELVLRLRAYIDAHLGDPTDADAARRNALISKRYLHKLFEPRVSASPAGSESGGWNAAGSALVDPRWREETIASVGVRCGLTDAAHFSRLFAKLRMHTERIPSAGFARSVITPRAAR